MILFQFLEGRLITKGKGKEGKTLIMLDHDSVLTHRSSSLYFVVLWLIYSKLVKH